MNIFNEEDSSIVLSYSWHALIISNDSNFYKSCFFVKEFIQIALLQSQRYNGLMDKKTSKLIDGNFIEKNELMLTKVKRLFITGGN